MHWDFVITSFEPISAVTGGIGTYVRSLLEEFRSNNLLKNKSVLFLTPHVVSPDWLAAKESENIKVVLVDSGKKYGGNEINYLGDEHSYFSFKVADYLETICNSGDTLGFIEFSDYGRDGYYFIKKKRLGLISCDAAYIRLHSPDLMLYHDNGKSIVDMDTLTSYKIEQELYCYKHCDGIIYGGDEMLFRVERETSKYNISVVGKSIKIPHPFVRFDRSRFLATENQSNPYSTGLLAEVFTNENNTRILYTGRLERRKGVLNLIESIIENDKLCSYIENNHIYMLFCGKDTNTAPGGASVAAVMQNMLIGKSVAKNIIFVGYVNQNALYSSILPNVDAYIFPSIFENYPNVLIESFPFGKPTLVSCRGCMPEMSKDYPLVSVYDPLTESAGQSLEKFIFSLDAQKKHPVNLKKIVSLSRPILRNRTRLPNSISNEMNNEINIHENNKSIINYENLSDIHNNNIAFLYNQYLNKDYPKSVRPKSCLSVSFIVPHYNNADYIESCIKSIIKCKKKEDEIIIVDDSSLVDEQARLKGICTLYDVSLIILQKNRGPSVARNQGAAQSRCDLIQFVDADDILDKKGFEKARLALEINNNIDFTYGITHTFGATEHLWMPRDSSLNVLEENYTHSAILIRREIFIETGGFDELLRVHYEDWEFNARLALLNKTGEAIPYITLHYRQKHGSRNISNIESIVNSRKLVIERSIYNTISTGKLLLKDSNIIYKLGVYLNGWVSSALWIEEQNKNIDNLQIKLNLSVPQSSQIATNYFIEPSLVNYPTAESKNFKMHIFENNLRSDYDNLVKKVNDKVLGMSFDDRIEFLKSSKLFDAKWYLAINHDLRAANVDPYQHYDKYGWREKRNPNSVLSANDMDNVIDNSLQPYNFANKLILFEILLRK